VFFWDQPFLVGWVGWVFLCSIGELPRFNQKRLEKCSTAKGQPYQPKPVAVETVDANRTRPKFPLLSDHYSSTYIQYYAVSKIRGGKSNNVGQPNINKTISIGILFEFYDKKVGQ